MVKKFVLVFSFSLITIAVLIGGVLVGGFFLFSNIVGAQFSDDLADTTRILNYKPEGFVIYDTNGSLIYQSPEARQIKYVSVEDLPDYLSAAVIAVEDERFYQHHGFDVVGIIRAFYTNLQMEAITEGASTITQQLARNSFLDFDKTYSRKLREVVLAIELERGYEKDDILEMYLNSVYFGSGAYGIENAANVYFNKSAKDLTLDEAALLAGLPVAPSELSPHVNLAAARARRDLVLRRMYELGYIRLEIYNEYSDREIETSTAVPPRPETRYPHFILFVIDELKKIFSESDIQRAGLRVHTTLDPQAQLIAEQELIEGVSRVRANNANNGSVVQVDPKTGAIRVMVGSIGWDSELRDGRVNMATSPRQPGSALKPLIYAAALDGGYIKPNTTLRDEPTTFSPNYSPRNYDRQFRGNVLPRRALANSLNVPSVEVLSRMGYVNALDSLQELGFTTIESYDRYGLAIVLGGIELTPLEMAGGFSALANGGVYTEPFAVRMVENKYDELIYEHEPQQRQIFSPETAYIVTSWLTDRQARLEVFGSSLGVGLGNAEVAIKTGTTDKFWDAWTMAYTPYVVTAVWVGNADRQPMHNLPGVWGAAPIMHPIMQRAVEGKEEVRFVVPSTLTRVDVCPIDGNLPCEGCGGHIEWFKDGDIPTTHCDSKYIERYLEEREEEGEGEENDD